MNTNWWCTSQAAFKLLSQKVRRRHGEEERNPLAAQGRRARRQESRKVRKQESKSTQHALDWTPVAKIWVDGDKFLAI